MRRKDRRRATALRRPCRAARNPLTALPRTHQRVRGPAALGSGGCPWTDGAVYWRQRTVEPAPQHTRPTTYGGLQGARPRSPGTQITPHLSRLVQACPLTCASWACAGWTLSQQALQQRGAAGGWRNAQASPTDNGKRIATSNPLFVTHMGALQSDTSIGLTSHECSYTCSHQF